MKFIYLIEKEGYGPSINSFQHLIDKNVKLIFTVDCGTLSFEAIEFAKKNKIDVIVLDHHQSEIKLPEAFSVVNPIELMISQPAVFMCGWCIFYVFNIFK